MSSLVKSDLFFVLDETFLQRTVLMRKHNPNKLTAKFHDHAGAQSNAYIPQRITNSK